MTAGWWQALRLPYRAWVGLGADVQVTFQVDDVASQNST